MLKQKSIGLGRILRSAGHTAWPATASACGEKSYSIVKLSKETREETEDRMQRMEAGTFLFPLWSCILRGKSSLWLPCGPLQCILMHTPHSTFGKHSKHCHPCLHRQYLAERVRLKQGLIELLKSTDQPKTAQAIMAKVRGSLNTPDQYPPLPKLSKTHVKKLLYQLNQKGIVKTVPGPKSYGYKLSDRFLRGKQQKKIDSTPVET